MDCAELSSNRSLTPDARSSADHVIPTRHPELCFSDGNVVILAKDTCFVVHQDPLSRHSPILKKLIEELPSANPRFIEGLPALAVEYSPEEVAYFLRTLYG